MLNSMTGYGRGSAEKDGRGIVIELRSVNHRYLDISPRMPRGLLYLEEQIRDSLNAALSRGHLDVYVNYSNTRQDTRNVICNQGLLDAYRTAAAQVAEHWNIQDDTRLWEWLRMPEVMTIEEAEEDQVAISALCQAALKEAILQLRDMRAREGARMQADLVERMNRLAFLRAQIGERAPAVVKEHQMRLSQRIEELLGNGATLDTGRLENEVAFFADKACIDEELVRLDSHIAGIHTIMESQEPTGRKLDFLVQELNREVNTIGSKANDAEISKCVVQAKAEIEKIREQVQNIE